MQDQDFKLTEQQICVFQTFGYLSFTGLMADRIEEIDREFEAVWSEHGGGHNGKPHGGIARSCIVPFIDQGEVLSSLLDDQRIFAIATMLPGEDFNYMGSDGNFYVGDTGSHSDGGHGPEERDPIGCQRDMGYSVMTTMQHIPLLPHESSRIFQSW